MTTHLEKLCAPLAGLIVRLKYGVVSLENARSMNPSRASTIASAKPSFDTLVGLDTEHKDSLAGTRDAFRNGGRADYASAIYGTKSTTPKVPLVG